MQSLFSPLLQLRTFFVSISAANCRSGDRILAPLFHSGRSSNREGQEGGTHSGRRGKRRRLAAWSWRGEHVHRRYCLSLLGTILHRCWSYLDLGTSLQAQDDKSGLGRRDMLEATSLGELQDMR
jgi:hypothetical protein